MFNFQRTFLGHGEVKRMCVPDSLVGPMVTWYHLALNHVGITRLFDTIHMNFVHLKMYRTCMEVCNPCDCQVDESPSNSYGELPAKNVTMVPWQTVAVDLIGPWNIKILDLNYKYRALMVVDRDTNFMDAVPVRGTQSMHIAMKFENLWIEKNLLLACSMIKVQNSQVYLFNRCLQNMELNLNLSQF